MHELNATLKTVFSWQAFGMFFIFFLTIILYRTPTTLKNLLARLRRLKRKDLEIELDEERSAQEPVKKEEVQRKEAEKITKKEERDLVKQALDALLFDKSDEYEKLMDEVISTAVDNDKKCKLNSDKYYFLYLFTGRSVIQHLEKIHTDYSEFYYPLKMIGMIFKRSENYSKAQEFYEKALVLCKNEEEKFSLEIEICQVLRLDSKFNEAINKLNSILKIAGTDIQRAKIYSEFGEIFLAQKDDIKAQEMFEASLRYNPEDFELRFSVAYRYSEMENCDNKAFHHYKLLYRQKPNYSYTRNNLAVLYEKLGMPIKANYLYRAAARQKQSLPMANLAIHLISKGFIDEAREWLKKASECEETSGRVGTALEKIDIDLREEEKKEEKISNDINIKNI